MSAPAVVPAVLGTVAGLAALGVIAELVARAALRRSRSYLWPPYLERELELDAETLPQMPSPVRFRANGNGARGDDPPSGDAFRIAVLGGSASECYFLDQPLTWPARLQALLDAPAARASLGGRRPFVENFGKSGIDVPTLTRVAERVLPHLGPLDAVVVMLGGGSVLRWLEAGAPADRGPTPYPEKDAFTWQPSGPYGWAPRETALAEVARRLLYLSRRSVQRRSRVGSWVGRARRMRTGACEWLTQMPSPDAMLAELRADLAVALPALRARARRLVVVQQPVFAPAQLTPAEDALLWNGGIGHVLTQHVDRFFTHEVLIDVWRRVDAVVAEAAREHGAEYVEVMSAVEPTARSYYDHFHFTPFGAERVAQTVAAALAGDARRADADPQADARAR